MSGHFAQDSYLNDADEMVDDDDVEEEEEEVTKKRNKRKKRQIPIANSAARPLIVPLPELTQLELSNAYKSELRVEREMFAPRHFPTTNLSNFSDRPAETRYLPGTRPKGKRRTSQQDRVPFNQQKTMPLLPRVRVDEFAAEYARQQDEERRVFIAAGAPGRVRNEAAAKKIARGEVPKTKLTAGEKQPQQQPQPSDGGWRLYSEMRDHGLDSPQR